MPQIVVTNNGNAENGGMQGIVYGSVAIYNTAAVQARPSSVFQLRAPVADFVGRDAELEQLVATLRPDQDGRSAAISGVRGMGGLGKTELAYAAAAQLRDDYPDGQILLELAGASVTPLNEAQTLQQVIRAFRPEDKLPEDLPTLHLLYRSALDGRKVLVLADDARDAAQVRPLLPPDAPCSSPHASLAKTCHTITIMSVSVLLLHMAHLPRSLQKSTACLIPIDKILRLDVQ